MSARHAPPQPPCPQSELPVRVGADERDAKRSAVTGADHAALCIGSRDNAPGRLKGAVHVKPHRDRGLVVARFIVQPAVGINAAEQQPEA